MKSKGVSVEQTSSGFKTIAEEKVIATTAHLKNIKEHK
jgi:hypothetical protein